MDILQTKNSKSEKCWYHELCKLDYDCGACPRYHEVKYMMENSNLPKSKQKAITLFAPDCDREAYKKLAEIKSNIYDFVREGKSLYIGSKYTGTGKAQPLDALILSEMGFVTMADINIGDNIYGDDGELHRVIGKFDRGERDVYRISFNDGTSTLCCDEHLWTVFDRNDRKYKTVELNTIIQNGVYSGSRLHYAIPICKPLKFNSKPLLLHPYVLAALIGDGSLHKDSLRFTNSEDDIVKQFNSFLPNGCVLKSCNSSHFNEYVVTDSNCKFIKGNNPIHNRIKDAIRVYGLMGKRSWEKFIPNDYLFSSIEDRIWLLRGLIDTDGRINPNSNTVSYCTTSIQLANDFKFLVQSLGGTVRITEKQSYYTYKGEKYKGRVAYICWCKFPSDLIPFSSIKHTNSYAFKQQFEPYRAICNVEFVGKMRCACIKTDNPTELYLTNDCIVTHNTSWSVKLMHKYFDEVWDNNGFKERALFIHVPTFLMRCKDFSNQDDNFNHVKNLAMDIDLVVWDDIASTDMSSYDFSQILPYIDHRCFSELSNIYTGNFDNKDDLSNKLGERLASRIWSKNTEIVIFNSKDLR